MSSRIRAVLSTTFICAAAAAVLLVPGAASATGAATIYTCVSKKSGAMRVVSAKTKCRHGEHKLSWNAAGPAGPAGATGATGAPGKQGASGVGIDFGTSKVSSTEFVHLGSGGEVVILSKTIPAGSYFVSAQTTLLIGEATTPAFVVVACGIADSSGTPAILEPGQPLDETVFLQTLTKTGTAEYGAESDLALQSQLTTTVPTTLALICAPIEGTSESTADAFDSQLSALQTTANE
ncbi:MAG: hypothetical protein ABR992_13670 [Solirubrobacteraceae bacterium]|jgi:hypothetical protein